MENALVGHGDSAGAPGVNFAGGERAAEDLAGVFGHAPGAAVADVGGVIEAGKFLPGCVAVELVDFGQRQRAGDEAAVVDEHAHDFELVAEAAAVLPLGTRGCVPRFLESVHAAAGPGADVELAGVDGEGVGLSVVGQLSAVGPVAAIEAKHASAVVACTVKRTVEGRDASTRIGFEFALSVGRLNRNFALFPSLIAFIAKESGRVIEGSRVQFSLKHGQAADGFGVVEACRNRSNLMCGS